MTARALKRIALAWVLLTTACAPFAGTRRVEPPERAFRISEAALDGDPIRRASVRLVLEGLEADTAGGSTTALARYERAVQIDPGDPYAYLALARFHADGLDPRRAEPFLDKAESLLRAEGRDAPRVLAHVIGLRGLIRWNLGRRAEAEPLLEQAREIAPTVWEDGYLAADELL